MLSQWNIIQEIEKLPHYREYTCHKCGQKQKVFILTINHNCEKCGIDSKMRGYGSIGTEIEDVIDSVLDWLGKNEEFEEAMKWKNLRDSYPDENGE